MNMVLKRKLFREDGIFSVLADKFFTLERSYDLLPKIPNGTYECVRKEHRLHEVNSKGEIILGKPFETFEITGVPGHTGLLFHIGNYNENSEGCVLVGNQIGQKVNGGKMIMDSTNAFKKFMELQTGVNSFTLVVE